MERGAHPCLLFFFGIDPYCMTCLSDLRNPSVLPQSFFTWAGQKFIPSES